MEKTDRIQNLFMDQLSTPSSSSTRSLQFENRCYKGSFNGEREGGEETGAMENNEIFVGKGGRWKEEEEEGVIEEKRSRQRT